MKFETAIHCIKLVTSFLDDTNRLMWGLFVYCYLLQIPEQFRFMSQHPVKKKHKHKKHKSQETERSKEGGEAVSQGSNLLEQDKPTPSSTGKCYLSI